MKVTRFAVLQINNDDILRNTDIMFRPTKELVESLSMDYSMVAIIDGTSLENVFMIGNVGEYESLIERLQDMRSISVGDVIHNLETDEMFCVDRIGFFPVELKEDITENV